MTVSLFPTLSLHQFDWHTEPFISLISGEGKEDKMQCCRAEMGFIHIILISNDGERRKRVRRERFKVNLIGNIWNATYLGPFQIAPHSLHSEWDDSFQRQGHQWIMAAITYSYATLHSVAFLAGILTSLSSQMPCQRGEAGIEQALPGTFEWTVCGDSMRGSEAHLWGAGDLCLLCLPLKTCREMHCPRTLLYALFKDPFV